MDQRWDFGDWLSDNYFPMAVGAFLGILAMNTYAFFGGGGLPIAVGAEPVAVFGGDGLLAATGNLVLGVLMTVIVSLLEHVCFVILGGIILIVVYLAAMPIMILVALIRERHSAACCRIGSIRRVEVTRWRKRTARFSS